MLTADGLTFSYNRKPLLEALSFQAAPGECVVLAGPNGSGKSTALSLLAGVLKPDAGSVRTEGRTGCAPAPRWSGPSATSRRALPSSRTCRSPTILPSLRTSPE